jgi:hypothetical protein
MTCENCQVKLKDDKDFLCSNCRKDNTARLLVCEQDEAKRHKEEKQPGSFIPSHKTWRNKDPLAKLICPHCNQYI